MEDFSHVVSEGYPIQSHHTRSSSRSCFGWNWTFIGWSLTIIIIYNSHNFMTPLKKLFFFFIWSLYSSGRSVLEPWWSLGFLFQFECSKQIWFSEINNKQFKLECTITFAFVWILFNFMGTLRRIFNLKKPKYASTSYKLKFLITMKK